MPRASRDARHMSRYVTEDPASGSRDSGKQWTDSTPLLSHEQEGGRDDPEQRYALYRLCECERCGGTGKETLTHWTDGQDVDRQPYKIGKYVHRCPTCRGEGRVKELLATCGTSEAVGVALVTLAREGEFEECPIGLLDRMGEKGQRWLVRMWLPSPRNVSDAAKLMRKQRA